MLTVMDAARRTGRNPETIRRWIRAGRLRAEKVGSRQLIDEADLDAAMHEPYAVPLPRAWRRTSSGLPAPDPVKAIHEARAGR